ncbi:MAG: EamA family transporter, partial [Rhodospirillaceae bacterium]|nr:EamA family transporter [Rhodospirillaceae bacterium]
PLGAAWITAAGACAACVGLLVQLASHHANDVMIIFTCYAVGLVIVTPLVLVKGLGYLKTPHPRLQVLRAMAGFIYFGSLFVAFRTIPLVDGILLRSTAPIWVPILLLIFWKQSMSPRLWWAIGLGFIGVALVLQPGSKHGRSAIRSPLEAASPLR